MYPSKKIDVLSAEKYGETRRKVKRFQHYVFSAEKIWQNTEMF